MLNLLVYELMSAFKANTRNIYLAFAKIHVQIGILGKALSNVDKYLKRRMQAIIDVRCTSRQQMPPLELCCGVEVRVCAHDDQCSG